MYGKIFDSMYRGTLYGQWEAIVTFQQLIVLCDSDGNIDMTPPAIAAVTSIPLEIIQKGIEALSRDDPYSRTPGRNGRRIELIDDHRPWGWVIVNHQKYKSLQDYDTVRTQTRERVRRHRETKQSVTVGNGSVTGGSGRKRHTDADTDTDTKKYKNKPSGETRGKFAAPNGAVCVPFEKFWRAYPKKRARGQAEKAWAVLEPDEQLQLRILAAIDLAALSPDWRKEGGQFVPYPATWLRARGWEDEMDVVTVVAPKSNEELSRERAAALAREEEAMRVFQPKGRGTA